MSQNYTVKDVKKGSVTKDSYGEYQNYALSVESVGEPVKLTRSIDGKLPEVGDVIYGRLEELDIGGKTYYKLCPETKPEQPHMTKDETIKAQWAIGQSVQIWIAQGCQVEAYDNIQAEAKHFYDMINTIRGEQ